MNRITEVTRRDILDIVKHGFSGSEEVTINNVFEGERIEVQNRDFNMCYYGRLTELDFLSRVYDLHQMPSTDSRFRNAYSDICQHTINNDDWDTGWIFSDSRFGLVNGEDEVLLNFLCEMFNPIVRKDSEPWKKFLEVFNELLKPDGYEIFEKNHISGRAVYSWREIALNSIVLQESNPAVSYPLTLIGEGSYAYVYRFKDAFYKRNFILKRAKKDLTDKELRRFKREFEQMQDLSSPYIVDVFCYNEENHEYIMEYMDCTLEKYISQNNGTLTFMQRKNLAAQALRAFKYIHSKDLLHRDICPKNVLIKYYETLNVVKVSDFGLVKIPSSELTSVSTDYKGYFNDPELRLEGFNTYCVIHETYAITRLIFFILTGRTNTEKIDNPLLKQFVLKGLNADKSKRFQDIDELISTFNLITE